jgi:hypothetical protein
VHRRAPVRPVRRARVLQVSGISPRATARRTGRQPAPPAIRPPRMPRAKSPPARTARAKNPMASNERPLLPAPAPLVLGRLVRAGAHNLPEPPPARNRPPVGDRAVPRILRRPSRNTSRRNRPSRNRGLCRGRRRRLSRSRCRPRSLSHDRRPAARPRALQPRRSRVRQLRRIQLPMHSRPQVPYQYGIRRSSRHPSNPCCRASGLAGRPSLLRETRLLSLPSSNPLRPSRSRRPPHPVGRPGRLWPDRSPVRRPSSARCRETSPVRRPSSARRRETSPVPRLVRGPRWLLD